MLTSQTLLYLVYVLAAASVIIGVEVAYLSLAGTRATAGIINRRLQVVASDAPASH